MRTVLISWLCLYMIPRRLRQLKAAEENLSSEKYKVCDSLSLSLTLSDSL